MLTCRVTRSFAHAQDDKQVLFRMTPGGRYRLYTQTISINPNSNRTHPVSYTLLRHLDSGNQLSQRILGIAKEQDRSMVVEQLVINTRETWPH